MSAPPRFDPLEDNVGRGGVPRDRYDRALLVPPGGGKRVPYTSMSTLAKQLGSDFALHQWELRQVAKGVGMSRELSAVAGSSRYDTRIGEEDEGRNREEAHVLDEVILHAKELAGAHQKARWGTAFHRYAEQGPDPLGEPPVDLAADLAAFHRTLALLGITVLDTEVFVVNETLEAAGSFDYLLAVPWRERLVIGDSKTGVLKLDQDEIQLAGYATSVIYDRDTDERISFEEKYGIGVDVEYGLTVHTRPMSGETHLYELDLAQGFYSAVLARDVHRRNREARQRYSKKNCQPLDVAAYATSAALAALERLAEAPLDFEETRAELRRIHRHFKDIWHDELTRLGGQLLRARKEVAA